MACTGVTDGLSLLLLLLLTQSAQALGPQVVRTLLIPHLEPFMSARLFKAMGREPQPNAAEAATDGSNRTSNVAAISVQHQQRDAWQLYGVLLSATGAAMYDLLITQMHSKLPLELVLARSGKMAAPGDWEAEYTQTLLAVKQASRRQLVSKQDMQGNSGRSAAGAAGRADGPADGLQDGMDVDEDKQTEAAVRAVAPMNGVVAVDGSSPVSNQEPLRELDRASRAAGAARLKGNRHLSTSAHQATVAQILGQSWKEDSDVNATLGALLHLFGEDLLSCLPLAELSAVNM
jgi:hypothetical protein